MPCEWALDPSARKEITITAHPEKVSPATLLIVEMLRAKGTTVDVRQYWHCCEGVAPRFPSPEKQQQLRLSARTPCGLRVNFIWKDVERPHLVVSSSTHIPIEGESNIVKYLGRALIPALYSSDFIKATQIDAMIDIAEKLWGNSRNQKAAMKEPNAVLGKSPFVVGDTMTLADAYLWSCLVGSGAAASGNVKKWKGRLEEDAAFANALSAYESLL